MGACRSFLSSRRIVETTGAYRRDLGQLGKPTWCRRSRINRNALRHGGENSEESLVFGHDTFPWRWVGYTASYSQSDSSFQSIGTILEPMLLWLYSSYEHISIELEIAQSRGRSRLTSQSVKIFPISQVKRKFQRNQRRWTITTRMRNIMTSCLMLRWNIYMKSKVHSMRMPWNAWLMPGLSHQQRKRKSGRKGGWMSMPPCEVGV